MSEDKKFECKPLTREDMENARKAIMDAPLVDPEKYIFHCIGCDEVGPWEERNRHACKGIKLECREKLPKYIQDVAKQILEKEED